jgi:hypothetical protein
MKATFDNQEREFHIARDQIPFLEFSLGRGLYDVLQDAVAGKWTFSDVAMVISYALHGPSKEDRGAIEMAKMSMKMGFPTRFARHYRPHPKVVEALEGEGHGNYAGVMADALTECIFGEAPPTKIVDDEYGNNVEVPDAAAA